MAPGVQIGKAPRSFVPIENKIKIKNSETMAQTAQVSNIGSLSILFGVQWFSGRVLDSRPRGPGFEPHRHHCVLVLEQDTFILA